LKVEKFQTSHFPIHTSKSSGRRIRTFTSLLNREVPYQFGYTGVKSGVRLKT